MLNLPYKVAISDQKTQVLLREIRDAQDISSVEQSLIKAFLNYINDDANQWFIHEKNSDVLTKYFLAGCLKFLPHLQTLTNHSNQAIIETIHTIAQQLKELLQQVSPLHMDWLSHFAEHANTLMRDYDFAQRESLLQQHFLSNLINEFHRHFLNNKVHLIDLEKEIIIPCKKNACIVLFDHVFSHLVSDAYKLRGIKTKFKNMISQLFKDTSALQMIKNPRISANDFVQENVINRESAKWIYHAYLTQAKKCFEPNTKSCVLLVSQPLNSDFFRHRSKPERQTEKAMSIKKNDLQFS